MATSYYFGQSPPEILTSTPPSPWASYWGVSSPAPLALTVSGDPGVGGGSGSRLWSADLTVADWFTDDGGGLYWTAIFARTNSAGTVQASVVASGFVDGNGTWTASITGDLGVFGATDRFRVSHVLSTESPKGSVEMTIQHGPASSVVTAPWTLAPPEPSRRPIRHARIRRF